MDSARLQPQQRVVTDERGMLDLPFLILTILLVLIGLVMMFSASYARAYAKTGNSAYYFTRQAIFAVLGIGAMFVISRMNYQLWRMVSFPMLAVSVVLLIAVLLFGQDGGGARRWFTIAGINFQPSEVAKLAVILSFATLISGYREKMETFRYGVLPFACILAVIVALLALEPHLSCIIIICGVGGAMMFMGGTRFRWFAVALALVGVFVFVYLNFMGYASDRITAWRDPFADATDTSYQVVQSLYAIGSGGLWGLGLGRGRQKYLYLPEEHNDYIFAVTCEELGFVGACLIVLLFVLLILRGYWIALHARDRFGMLIVAGITTLLALQVFFNIGVVTNFLPSTGISLPFFSYGGTALLMQLAEMGIVLNVSRYNRSTLI